MSRPEDFTREQASDPSTPAQTLADIAALRDDLRPLVAKNPAAYPGLLDWLGSLGEPAVDRALRERAEAAPAADDAPAGPVLHAPFGASGGTASYGAPAGTTSSGAPYAAPGGAAAAGQAPSPVATSPYGAPPVGDPYSTQPGPYGPPAGGPYGGPYRPGPGFGQPQPKRSRRTLWIVLGVVGGLLVVGLVVGAVLLGRLIGSIDDYEDPELDALRTACSAGDWEACDDLYVESPFGSEDERFGSTCGQRTEETFGGCVEELGGGDTGSSDPSAYGDDPELDGLWDACAGGDLEACDSLYWQAPIGSEYEEFGSTCGGTGGAVGVGPGSCADTEQQSYGQDADLDALHDACGAGDGAACESLFWEAPVGSDYEEFGATCGGREERGSDCTP